MDKQLQDQAGLNLESEMNETAIDTALAVLCDYATGVQIRNATLAEQEESREAAESDGGSGVITVDGRNCYVED